MQSTDLSELHNIAAVENVASILEHGILSHRRAAKIKHRSVAMQKIQDIRAGKKIPEGRLLHQYANLYINGRNAMLSKVLFELSIDEICLLRVSTDVLDIAETVVSDQNAASDYVRFFSVDDGLARLTKDYVFATSWKHPENQIEEWRHKSAMCAEVLVPDVVPPEHILGAYVGSESGRRALSSEAPELSVVIDADKFLR